MSNWKLDYIRMWEIYFSKPMELKIIDGLINDRDGGYTMEAHIKGYKHGLFLEAVGRLKSPN